MSLLDHGRFLALACGAITIASVALAAPGGFDEASLRSVIRFTARVSLIFFLLAFVASAAHQLWRAPLTAWMRRNRRYLGLTFAYSHLVHAVAIYAAWRLASPADAAEIATRSMLIFGGIGYLCILLMSATSFDGAVRALGFARWRMLHLICGHYLWFQFLIAFGKRVPDQPAYAGFIALIAAAMAIRIAGKRVNVAQQATTLRTV